jgi:hypothetical protein
MEHNRESETPMIGPGQSILKVRKQIRAALSTTPAAQPVRGNGDTELIQKALNYFEAMPEAKPHPTGKGSTWALWTDGCNLLRAAIDAAQGKPVAQGKEGV